MASIWNNGISLSIFGESHSAAIGVVIDNLPPGKKINMDRVISFMKRRQAKSDGTTTSRIEPDIPEIQSGLVNGVTTGTPLAFLIHNTNVRSQDYQNVQTTVRPGHADYTGNVRYQGANDIRGGGHFSGRLTACMAAAGAVCGQILEEYGVYVAAHLLSVYDIHCNSLDTMSLTKEKLAEIRALPFPVINEVKRLQIIDRINQARLAQNLVGGVVECAAIGMPAGIGSPIFDNLESIISSIIFSIPGVKGIEFGEGFHAAELMGSENNDSFYYDKNTVKTKTNRHGGILGGISSGMPINFRVAMKPPPSISLEQDTIDLAQKKEVRLGIVGRHDPCIAARAVPVVEACCNIALLSAIIKQKGI